MPDMEDPLLERLRREVDRLGDEVRQMAALRWQLARLEIEADLGHARRLACGLSIAAVMGIAAVALACVALAETIQGWLGLSRTGWLVVLASVLLAGGLSLGGLAWRAFRRRFIGLRESLEELREDVEWMGEWMGRDDGWTKNDQG